MQDKVLPQASFIKGRFGGIVDMSRSRPTPANENRRNIAVSPAVVGHNIEISNRFIRDFEAATYIAKQCKTKSCHKSPFVKGRFGGIVYGAKDISPLPATIKKEGKSNDLSSMVGLHIKISNRFLLDYVAVFQIAKQCKATPCHKPPLSKGGLEGL